MLGRMLKELCSLSIPAEGDDHLRKPQYKTDPFRDRFFVVQDIRDGEWRINARWDQLWHFDLRMKNIPGEIWLKFTTGAE